MSNNISFLLLDGIVLRGLRHLVLLPPIPFLLPLAGPRAHDPLSGQVIYGHSTRSHYDIPMSNTLLLLRSPTKDTRQDNWGALF